MTTTLPPGTTDAIGEMLRVIGTCHRFEDSMRCLESCRLCRNSLLYLLDGATGVTGDFTRAMTSRVYSLPAVHERHHLASHPDHAAPQITIAGG